MSAEFIAISSDDGMNATAYGEYHLTLTLASDVESARERLSSAVEKLGYRIISEDPLVARRSGGGYGSVTTTTLDYARTLTLRLKTSGTAATLVTFNYVGYPLNYRGARVVITREAEAIIALASVRQKMLVCLDCGTEAVDDSRFCRRCGAPTAGEPAELQVMRLTNYAHSGFKDIFAGLAGITLAVITFTLIVLIKGIAHITPASIFALVLFLPSLFWLILGMRYLSRTFISNPTEKALASKTSRQQPSLRQITNDLPELPPVSITEGTTELLQPVNKEREMVSVERNEAKTIKNFE